MGGLADLEVCATQWRKWPEPVSFPTRALAVAAAAATVSRYRGYGRIGVETAQGLVELDVRSDVTLAELLTAADRVESVQPVNGLRTAAAMVSIVADDTAGAMDASDGAVVEVDSSGYRVIAAPLVAVAEEFAEIFDSFLRVISSPDAGRITAAEPSVLSELSARRCLALGLGPGVDEHEEQAHQAVFRIAAHRGDRVAFVDGERVVSYAQLAGLVSAACHRLRARGLTSGNVIAVALPRGLASAVAQLAAFSTGCAVAVLDPELPGDRLQFMLTDAGVDLLVSSEGAAAAAAAGVGVHRVEPTRLTDPDVPAATASDAALWSSRLPDDAVSHIAYTSGSTGTPKAVMLRHGPMSNTAMALIDACGIRPGDRCSWTCAPGVGMVEVDLFPALSAGATVIVAPQHVQSDPRANAEWLTSNGIRHSLQATVMAEQLMALPWPSGTPLRSLRLAGERCRSWPKEPVPFRVLNVYGSTEANVVAVADLSVTTSAPKADIADTGGSPPIGRAVRNVNIYVLDDLLRPVPHRGVGELCVTGRSLSRGYLNRADVNAEKFVANHVPGDPYPVLYRSGDLARFGLDGQLEVVGRVDDEVKISGFRVHPRDVEAAVCQLPDVAGCAVVPRTNGQAGTYLVAYVETTTPIPAGQEQHEQSALRERLARWLPSYMIPAAVIFSDLPVLTNGKLDRAELTRRAEADAEAARSLDTAPQETADPWIAVVAEAFSEVLGCGAVAADVNFFEIGGGSIQAANLAALIDERLAVSLELADMMADPTPRAIAGQARRCTAAHVSP